MFTLKQVSSYMDKTGLSQHYDAIDVWNHMDSWRRLGPNQMGKPCGRGWVGLRGACQRAKHHGGDKAATLKASKLALADKIKRQKKKKRELEMIGNEPTVQPIAKKVLPKVTVDIKTPMTHEDVIGVGKRLRSGDITADELKQQWERFKGNEDLIREGLGKMTIANLKANYQSYTAKTKAEWVRAGVESLESVFLSDSISYTIDYQGMSMGTVSRHSKNPAKVRAMDQSVSKWTDEEIQDRAEKRSVAQAFQKKAIANPETLDEFNLHVRIRGTEKMTPEQRRKYEELSGTRTKESRDIAAQKKAAIGATQTKEGTFGETQQIKHAKKGTDLHVIPVAERVDREKFTELKERAKKYGGYYSSFRGAGAVPGFHFDDPENAKKFRSLEADDRSESIAETRESRALKISSRLAGIADKQEAQANESLGQSRQTNTAKRSREAGYAEDRARKQIQRAGTLRNLAEAQASGQTKFLGKIQDSAQLTQLEDGLLQSHWAMVQSDRKAGGRRFSRDLDGENDGVNEESIDHAKYPYPRVRKDQLRQMLDEADKTPGLKKIAAKLRKEQSAKGEDDGSMLEISNPSLIQDLRTLAKRVPATRYTERGKESAAESLGSYDRVQRMDLKTPAEYRSGLREYLKYRDGRQQADPIVALERKIALGGSGVDYFPTPKAIVSSMIKSADIRPGMEVLEPSAGAGHIADELRKSGASVKTIEQSYEMSNLLKMKGHDVDNDDFLSQTPEPKYDRVVMNPPFGGIKSADIDHVKHAYEFLKPGGKLVSIMSEGSFSRSGKKEQAFKDWVDNLGGESEKLDQGSFLQSDVKTGVSTRQLTIEKPMN